MKKLLALFCFTFFCIYSPSQVFNKVGNTYEMYVPLDMPIYTVDKDNILIHAPYIKDKDSNFKLVRFNNKGDISLLKKMSFYQTEDTFITIDDIELYKTVIYASGYQLYKTNKSNDSFWMLENIILPLDKNTLAPIYSLKVKKTIGICEGYAPIYADRYFQLHDSIKMKVDYTWLYNSLSKKFEQTNIYTKINFEQKTITNKLISLGNAKSYNSPLGNYFPYQNYFYSFGYHNYDYTTKKIDGMIYRFDNNLEFLDSHQMKFIDTNVCFDLLFSSFRYGIKYKNSLVHFHSSIISTKSGNTYKDSFGIFAYNFRNDSLNLIKKIYSVPLSTPGILPEIGNDIIVNPDQSIYLTFWDGFFSNGAFQILKLDSNLNIIWNNNKPLSII